MIIQDYSIKVLMWLIIVIMNELFNCKHIINVLILK